jgi:hypothetical protein
MLLLHSSFHSLKMVATMNPPFLLLTLSALPTNSGAGTVSVLSNGGEQGETCGEIRRNSGVFRVIQCRRDAAD